jgi:hypothetical protein
VKIEQVLLSNDLVIARMSDNTLRKAKVWEVFKGMISSQMSLTWDGEKYTLMGIGRDRKTTWKSTFNSDGNFNNDWEKVITPVPIGWPGSKTNPIPLNKAPQAGYLYPSNGGGNSGCEVTVSGKVYFMLDPSPHSMAWTRLTIKGYSNTTLKYWKQAQTKAGVDIGGEVSIYNSQGDGMDNEIDGAIYDFSTTRFLYAIEGTQAIDIYVQYFK